MPDVTVKAEHLPALVRAVKAHADPKAIRRELNRGISSASKPVREEMRATAIASLPVRGGLQARMEGVASKGRTTISGGQNAGVRINFAKKGYDRRTLRGHIRHPLFGNRSHWFTNTAAQPDAIDIEFQMQRPEVQQAIQEALEFIAGRIANSS